MDHEHHQPNGRRRRAAIALSLAAAIVGGAGISAAHAADNEHKVTLCHASDSSTNPYVAITVDYHAVVQGGHGGHDGPRFSPDLPAGTKWGDIIPPFDFGPDAQYAGMNFDTDGQALLANGCVPVVSTTTTGGG